MINFKALATSLFTGLALFVANTDAEACTSFLVGKKASADGSAFITYNQDDYACLAVYNTFLQENMQQAKCVKLLMVTLTIIWAKYPKPLTHTL